MDDALTLMRQALDAGHYSVKIDGTRHWVVADCPTHGVRSPVSMPIKEGRRIVALVFRCPLGCPPFRRTPDEVYLD